MTVPADVVRDYELFLAGRRPVDIRSFGGVHSRRDVVELVIAQQALALAGQTQTIQFSTTDSYARQLREVQDARALIAGTTFWLNDLTSLRDSVFVSEALASSSEIEVGF